jgi:hypothetical protein
VRDFGGLISSDIPHIPARNTHALCAPGESQVAGLRALSENANGLLQM